MGDLNPYDEGFQDGGKHERAKRPQLPSELTKVLVDRFLAWNLPKSVCSDTCVTDAKYQHSRSGTNLLSADEARQMIEHLLSVHPST